MATKKHAPSLYHPDLYRFGVPQDPSDLIANPDSWFAAVKLMRACIDQGRRDFSVLNDHISQLESKIATLKTENQDTKSENTDLLEKNTKANLAIVNLRSQVDMLSQDASHLGKRHLSKNLPDPELYNGDKQKLRSWIHSLKMKLAGNSDHYPTESSKIQYSIGRLRGKAVDQIGLKVRKDGTTGFATAYDLITYLEVAFGDPDEKSTSQRKLRELRQDKRAFSDYLADFLQIADCTGYNEEAKRADLLAGLSQEIQQALVVVDLPNSLEGTIAQIQKIDNKLRAFNSRTNQNLSQQLGPQPNCVQSASSSASGFSHPSGATLAAIPMDLRGSRTRGPITPMERRRRMDNNLCMYCGDANHWVEGCPAMTMKVILRKRVVSCEKHPFNSHESIKSTTSFTHLSPTNPVDLLL